MEDKTEHNLIVKDQTYKKPKGKKKWGQAGGILKASRTKRNITEIYLSPKLTRTEIIKASKVVIYSFVFPNLMV